MIDALKQIQKDMKALGINYAYDMYYGDTYPYWVGRYVENQEDITLQKYNNYMTISGFTRESALSLEYDKAKIKEFYKHGKHYIINNKSINIYYQSSSPIPQEDINLKRVDISLDIILYEI